MFFALIATASAAFAADDVVTKKVIGLEFEGRYKHPASFEELDNGDIYVAYYGGDGEYEDSKVWGMRLRKGSEHWTTPEVIADTPFLGEGNPAVWQAPDGLVWLFYVQRYGDTWSQARIKAKISRDGARTWSDSMMVAFEEGMMCRGKPIALNNGEYLLPIYYETGSDREMTAPDTHSMFLRFNPETKKWTESGRIYSDNGNLQPEPVQITDDYLIAYCRRGGNFEPIEEGGYAIRSESRDGGHTWSRGVDTEFLNPNSAIGFIKLQNGHLLMVYNDNMNERTPLTIAISTDNDKTWPHRRNIGEGENTFAYPMAMQTKDGKIHILYTTNERSQIMHAVFEESAITNQP